ncbi:MAG: glycoside hydrolase [Chloroflexi bacterium]|nr:MAG: glycoside hydrolase [Chloroflexota bacterium]
MAARSFLEEVRFLRKKIVAFCITALLGIIFISTNLTPLRVVDSEIGALLLAPQLVPNPAPKVIPSLREWQGRTGFFTLSPTSRIVTDPSYTTQLESTAKVFQDDLFSMTGYTFPIVTTISPGAGDFFLTLNNLDPSIGSEGYLFQVDDTVVISAHSRTGVFYGTRTALQILLQDITKSHIPKGIARDYPQYAERGFMLDAGRKFFSIHFLEDYVKFMAWYKMNDFHIHLNDNALGGGDSPDWMHSYAAFRLNSSRFPGLAAKDGSYTRQDIRALQDIANAYGVTITPEIDVPAHALAFTQYRPDLASPNFSKEFLDLNNPATYTFMNNIWDEFLPWFDAKQVDIGADEYSPSASDQYMRFINTYDAYLRSRGKTMRMWGTLTKMQSSVKVNTDIVLDDWNNGWANPVDMANEGFSIINANDNLLYIVPKAGYYHDYLDTQMLYEQWEPNIFSLSDPGLNLQPGGPHLLGGMFSDWNDRLGSNISDADVHARVKPAMQTLSQKLWSAATAGISYDQFQQLAHIIGEAPGTHLP